MKYQTITGTHDIIPPATNNWQMIENTARELFDQYCYNELRTPIIEPAELFERGLGEITDVVQKEMYILEKGDDRICLRPEATASVVRALLQNNIHKNFSFNKFFYIGPMFRHERPQAGRTRQFHQLGVEAIGSLEPTVDVEVIALAVDFLERLNMKGTHLKINSLGCKKCREKYRDILHRSLQTELSRLCPTCQQRYERNIFRILDCKERQCREVIQGIPGIQDYLDDDCGEHFNFVLRGLKKMNIDYEVNPLLVRGLDYYTRTVFEVTCDSLGAQDALIGGGRYDNLVAELGGPEMGAAGFALGIERLLIALKKSGTITEEPKPVTLFICAAPGEAEDKTRRLTVRAARNLRMEGIRCETDFENRSMKSQMRLANRLGAEYVLFLNDASVRNERGELKTMSTGEQVDIEIGQIPSKIKSGT